MPLINDYNAVKEIYQEAAERGIALPAFCAEDRETLEAILASALELGKKIGVNDLPIAPAWTSRYPARPQMTFATACGNPVLGTQLMFSDLKEFMSESSPYRKLRVMPHLDHAFPWLDSDILERFVEQFATVMCDASEKSFEENIEFTAEYVEKVKGKVMVEGAVDEIYEAGGGEKNEPTTVEQAEEFISKTGVDLIVPNVGTEHRSTGKQVEYLSGAAQNISAKVGKILCIHGTSSVKPEDLPKLPVDGFVKINVFTTLAVKGGQAVACNVLDNLTNIFDEDQLKELVQKGILQEDVITSAEQPAEPKLACVANALRRDAWFEAVRDRCREFLEIFNYRLFKK